MLFDASILRLCIVVEGERHFLYHKFRQINLKNPTKFKPIAVPSAKAHFLSPCRRTSFSFSYSIIYCQNMISMPYICPILFKVSIPRLYIVVEGERHFLLHKFREINLKNPPKFKPIECPSAKARFLSPCR